MLVKTFHFSSLTFIFCSFLVTLLEMFREVKQCSVEVQKSSEERRLLSSHVPAVQRSLQLAWRRESFRVMWAFCLKCLTPKNVPTGQKTSLSSPQKRPHGGTVACFTKNVSCQLEIFFRDVRDKTTLQNQKTRNIGFNPVTTTGV